MEEQLEDGELSLPRLRAELEQRGFTLGRELGAGGMGRVFLAFQESLSRNVAVKVIHPRFAQNAKNQARFERESRVMAAQRHPSIVAVFDRLLLTDGSQCLIMELVEGPSLADVMHPPGEGQRKFSVDTVIKTLRPIAHALDFLHSRKKSQVIHRDVKPANILLPPHNDAMLTDFGIARVSTDTNFTGTGIVLGTVSYTAPELFQVGRLEAGSAPQPTPSSDNYSLALVALEMLTGVQLASIMSPAAWKGPRDIKGIPHLPYRKVFRKALDNNPGERYATATEFIDALAQSASRYGSRETSTRFSGEVSRNRRMPRAIRRVLATLVAAVMVGAGGFVAVRASSGWSEENQMIADAFPGIVSEREGGQGFRGATCTPGNVEEGQYGKVRCRLSDAFVVLADYGSASRRAEHVKPSELETFADGECSMQSGEVTMGNTPTYAVLPEGNNERFALLVSGAGARELRLSLPVCR